MISFFSITTPLSCRLRPIIIPSKLLVYSICSFLFIGGPLFSQELRATVSIEYEKINTFVEKPLMDELKRQLENLLNETQWTELTLSEEQRIQCTFLLALESYQQAQNKFSGFLRVNGERPVYNTSYTTITFSIRDNDFEFNYFSGTDLTFVENNTSSNLVNICAYYAYAILGAHFDSFAPLGGTDYWNEATRILNLAQNTGYAGWNIGTVGSQSRYTFINELSSDPNMNEYRKEFYTYHLAGLDILESNGIGGRTQILNVIKKYTNLFKSSNPYFLQAFLDAKNGELINLFRKASTTEKAEFLSLIQVIDGGRISFYEAINQTEN